MTHLLLVAHGSRRAASNDEVRRLTARLAATDHPFAEIDCAFLELAEPSIPDGLRHRIAAGATKIVVLPYFLSAGRHVSDDIPAAIAEVQAEAPHIAMQIAPYLGEADAIAALLLQQALRGLSASSFQSIQEAS